MSKPYDCPERNIHDIRNFTSQVEKYFTRSLCSLVKYYSTLEEKFCISAGPCDILYILTSNTKISTQIKMVTSSLAMISATVEFTMARMSPKNWSGKRVFLIQKNLSVFSRYWAMLLNCEETRKSNKQQKPTEKHKPRNGSRRAPVSSKKYLNEKIARGVCTFLFPTLTLTRAIRHFRNEKEKGLS